MATAACQRWRRRRSIKCSVVLRRRRLKSLQSFLTLTLTASMWASASANKSGNRVAGAAFSRALHCYSGVGDAATTTSWTDCYGGRRQQHGFCLFEEWADRLRWQVNKNSGGMRALASYDGEEEAEEEKAELFEAQLQRIVSRNLLLLLE